MGNNVTHGKGEGKMNIHDHHDHCHHELKYCEHCDCVYCTKCGLEWKKPQYYWWPYYPYVNPYPTWTYTSGSAGNTLISGDVLTVNQDIQCSH